VSGNGWFVVGVSVVAGCFVVFAAAVCWMFWMVFRQQEDTDSMIRRFEQEDNADREWREAIRTVEAETEWRTGDGSEV
jgi:hypothetical protein